MDDEYELGGLRLEGYRSFPGGTPQQIGPLGKVHLLAGPNNSGKSNVLRAAQTALHALKHGAGLDLDLSDRPYGDATAAFRVGVARAMTREELEERLGMGHQLEILLMLLRGSGAWSPDSGLLWVDFELREPAVPGGGQATWAVSTDLAERMTSASEASPAGRRHLEELSTTLTHSAGGPPHQDASRVLDKMVALLHVRTGLPAVQTLDAFRRIGPAGATDALNGPGLIGRLAQLQHPNFGQEADLERFERINRFLRTLFDDADTSIEIQHDHQEILVRHGGRRLPLANYGTGLHQAVILAAAATVLSRHLICIEEPEVHLHPTLQRKLLRYLREETDNRYLVATHSASLLDSALASISAVRQTDGASAITAALAPPEVAAISAELGLRASDLVQSNAVIWVEGPSDRIYLKAWIAELAPELTEGVHYSLLFYGGSLLRHLSPEDPAVEEFVALPRINRSFWVVIDSDCSSADAPLNDTKLRVQSEMAEYAGLGGSWVTAGYTVENYVPGAVLRAAVTEVHPTAEPDWDGQRYEDPLASGRLGLRRSPADKAAVARAVCGRWGEVSEWPLDLRDRVDEVIAMIRRANDLEDVG